MITLSFDKLFILIALIISGCTLEHNKEEEFYYVYCFHPLKKVVKLKVSERVWNKIYYSNNFSWRFQTKTGKKVKASYCYTDNSKEYNN